MGEIVNLRRVRKAKLRAAEAEKAAANRAQSGQTKAERAAEAARRAVLERDLDNAKLEPD